MKRLVLASSATLLFQPAAPCSPLDIPIPEYPREIQELYNRGFPTARLNINSPAVYTGDSWVILDNKYSQEKIAELLGENTNPKKEKSEYNSAIEALRALDFQKALTLSEKEDEQTKTVILDAINLAIEDIDSAKKKFLEAINTNKYQEAEDQLHKVAALGHKTNLAEEIPPDALEKIREFRHQKRLLTTSLAEKNLQRAEEITTSLLETTGDPQWKKIREQIQENKNDALQQIEIAKRQYCNQQLLEAERSIRIAYEIWPQAPKLSEIKKKLEITTVEDLTAINKTLTQIEDNPIELYNNRDQIDLEMLTDEKRLEVENTIKLIAKFHEEINKARELKQQGKLVEAWETLREIKAPKSTEQFLHRERILASEPIQPFPSLIEQALALKRKNDPAGAISLAHQAKKLQPNSKLATQTITWATNQLQK